MAEEDELRTYGSADPIEFSQPGYSRTGIELLEHNGYRWFEYAECCVSPVAITLEDKAALTCKTGNWGRNYRCWLLLPRWQRAKVGPA